MDSIVQTVVSLLNGERAIILVLVGLIGYVMLQKRVDPKKRPDEKDAPPTEEEFKQMLADFKPEPLIPSSEKYLSMLPIEPIVVNGPATATIQIGDKVCLNLATTNFLGFSTNPKITEAAKKALQKYGCGACGPRGFYGTIDVHDTLEKHIARFYGATDAILYPSAYATMSSIIPTFAARGELLVVDEAVSHSIRLGVELSRAEVQYYRHNDMKHLEEILSKVKDEEVKGKRKLARRFIVFEGLFCNTGDIAPLKKIVELKDKYCFRVLMDDSYALGVLGRTGHGSLEYHGIAANTIDMIAGSLGHALGSSGGFCAGTYSSVYHQRLNSSGYVFSASPPPYLVVAADTALTLLETSSEKLIEDLHARANQLRSGLSRVSGVTVLGSVDSPLVHVRLAKSRGQRIDDEKFWQAIVDQCREQSAIAVTRAHYNPDEKQMPSPGLRLTVCAQHSAADIERAITVLSQAIKSALQ